tara:strand:- start:66 stop:269 length:204 start_codon:yes stop_codon:yes gene_type:complete
LARLLEEGGVDGGGIDSLSVVEQVATRLARWVWVWGRVRVRVRAMARARARVETSAMLRGSGEDEGQ